ncbi:V-type ATP synthase subunit I [Peptoniphilus lacrimalis]|uniref:V-type ATP synthase subunit I n=1 Tax=Peptoniphilus lacrimalis TaxID=33031 RepID=UPI00254E83A9|nr:V-type ATP synthase subunit I [Peptoniphilus lacrimalis]MDK7721755.1 V-type ATP synthase subunit I [Peptoniphilus lacrimalis]MDK7731357.1 V-type ATP synthase subunit I [Peptoniphilus lacrimalis]
MAIVDMSKFYLLAFKEKRESLLKELQKFKYVHLVDSGNDFSKEDLSAVSRSEELIDIDDYLNKSKYVIERLEKIEDKKPALEALKEGKKHFTYEEIKNRARKFNFSQIYKEISSIIDEIEKKEAENQEILNKVSELLPYKAIDLPLEDLKLTKFSKIYLGTIPQRYKENFEELLKENDSVYFNVLHTDKNYAYYLIICHKSDDEDVIDAFRKMGFTLVNFKEKGTINENINSLRERKSQNLDSIDTLNKELKNYLKYLDDFKIYYEYQSNEKLKVISSEKFLRTKNLDLIEGYVPSEFLKSFEDAIQLICGDDYYLYKKEADRNSHEVPIMLKNNKFVGPFEMLTEMYSMPKYNEIDPTPFFAPFYFIFAGIMIGDLGYGLLVFIGSLLALKFFNLDKATKRFMTFFNYLSISAMIFGLVFGSFFGGIIPLPTLINPAEDIMEMLMLSLLLGGVHIFFALGIKAYMDIRDNKPKDAFYDVGLWYMALIGAIGYGLSKAVFMNPIVVKILFYAMIIAMVGIVLTGGRSEKTTLAKFGWGVYALYGISSYIGDFVSYLRLMALVLSGSFIGLAVNMIAGMLFGSSVIGKLFAIVIFLVFQAFNCFLCYLSAYVHTARLTYVEMFNKFYEGGGVPFKKMVEDSKYFNID